MNKTKHPANGPFPRRTFLKTIWIGLGFIGILEIIYVIITFFLPKKSKGPEGGDKIIEAGRVDSYGPGTVSTFIRGRFYLVRLEDGGFLAVSNKCPHLGCSVPWNDDEKRFICPCHSSVFDVTGAVIESPAPRALDLYPIKIVNNYIRVDTNQAIKRPRFNRSQSVYPETVKIINKGA